MTTSSVSMEAVGVSEHEPAGLAVWCKPRPLSEWTEEMGDVLWWRFPVAEPPYCGTPNDLGYTVELHTHDSYDGPRIATRCSIGGWPGGHTHFTPIPMPWAPPAAAPAAPTTEAKP